MNFKRFAIYYVPRRASVLEAFGNSWLGWDPRTCSLVQRPDITGLSRDEIIQITQTPARYSFHGTIKPPFALRPGLTVDDLDIALQNFARSWSRFECGPLKLTEVGPFLALCPDDPDKQITTFAAECVKAFDEFREPETASGIERRRKGGLTPRQDALLLKWGYPYVMEELRFHLTLTEKLGPSVLAKIKEILGSYLGNLCEDRFTLQEVALFGDPGEGRPFQEIKRYELQS